MKKIGPVKERVNRPASRLRKMGFTPLGGAMALEVKDALEAESIVGACRALGVEAYGFVRTDGSGQAMVLVP